MPLRQSLTALSGILQTRHGRRHRRCTTASLYSDCRNYATFGFDSPCINVAGFMLCNVANGSTCIAKRRRWLSTGMQVQKQACSPFPKPCTPHHRLPAYRHRIVERESPYLLLLAPNTASLTLARFLQLAHSSKNAQHHPNFSVAPQQPAYHHTSTGESE